MTAPTRDNILVVVPNREDPRLGRIVEHDSRSWSYAYRGDDAPISVTHKREVPIFNQGNLGSCTGNAALGCIGTGNFYATTKDKTKFDQDTAVGIYSRATNIDEFRGEYPPTDTGSSGLAVAKVLLERKLIKGYQHAMSFEAALSALNKGPVITGVPWFDTFSKPGADGFIRRTSASRNVGGHEFVVHANNPTEEYVTCTNSWGASWGVKGTFKMRWDLWSWLLGQQGDVTVFVPLDGVAPTPEPPAPTPVPNAVDKALWDAAQTWGKAKGFV